jgi:hypothetical protein
MNDVLQIIFSGLVAISTVIYSLLTWKLVTETRKIRKFQITPDINIYFERAEADASFVYIVFKNSGLGHAKNVKFEILKDFEFYDNENFQLNKKGIIKDGVDNFYSNQFYKFFFTDLSQKNAEKRNANLIIQITYYSIDNSKIVKKFNLSLSGVAGISILTPPDNYIGRIAHELREIKQQLKKITDKEE